MYIYIHMYHITAAYLEAAASAHAAPREFDQLEGLASVAWRGDQTLVGTGPSRYALVIEHSQRKSTINGGFNVKIIYKWVINH